MKSGSSCKDNEAWAAASYKPLPGQLVFYDATAQIPQETIGFAAGHCTHYGEEFDAGRNGGAAAYVCRLTISAEVFELLAGGVSARAFPAAVAVAAAVSKAVTAPAGPPPPPTDAEIAQAASTPEAEMAQAVTAADAAAERAAAAQAPASGEQHLALTEAAFEIYKQQLPAALQTLRDVFGEFGQVTGRAKSPESAANRIQRAVDNGWAKKMETPDDVLANLWDAVGTRVVLSDSSPDTMSRLTGSLIAAIKSGKITVTKIENLCGEKDGLPYLSAENAAAIKKKAKIDVSPKPYKSGYTVTTMFVEYAGGVRGEIQLIGQHTLALANAEHLVYDASLNKPYLGSYEAASHEEVKAQIEPIRESVRSIERDPAQKEAYLQYLSGSYTDARRVESGLPVQPPPFPPGVPAVLHVTNLLAVNERTGKFKRK